MIVIDKIGSSDCSNHKMDAIETRVPHLGGEVRGVKHQGIFFFFLTRDDPNLFKRPVCTGQILRRYVSSVGD